MGYRTIWISDVHPGTPRCAADALVDAFETALAREAARRGLAGVVCGHIHRPALRDVGPVLYANSGDWVESLTAIVEHPDGRLELVSPTAAVRSTPAAQAGEAPR